MLSRVVFLFIWVSSVFGGEAEFWAKELKNTDDLEHISVYNARFGQRYLRGFPLGAWGTIVFPVLPITPTENAQEYIDTVVRHIKITTDLRQSYKDFREQITKAFCNNSEDPQWTCCQSPSEAPNCKNPTNTARNIMHILLDPIQSLPNIFLHRWCTRAWALYNTGGRTDLEPLLKSNCPNTCLGNPCQHMMHVNNSAFCEPTGPFENDFKCDCMITAQWDPNLLLCRPKNPCLSKDYSPCHPENTIRCVARDEFHINCICKAEFMGTDCSLPRNACLERLNKSQPTGNQNCRVQFGNECYGFIGTDQYNCTCRYGYEPLLTTPEDNCFARRDLCQTYYAIESMNKIMVDFETVNDFDILNIAPNETKPNRKPANFYIVHRGLTCLNGGQCITSSDLTRAMCICPTAADGSPLFLGPNCEIPVGTWSAWSSMSPCIPKDCGHTRYRWRRRRCLNTTSAEALVALGNKRTSVNVGVLGSFSPPVRCSGTSEEVIPCDPLSPCMILRLPGYLRDEILNYDSLYYFGCITIGYLVISLSAWYVFASPVMKALQKRKRKHVAAVISTDTQDYE
ncbi:hypothetical protein PHET_06836 [Paragonimus heterotremus]|uniref:EGF-like domain-containing protein n=1 Tax=Paragonimus heterotremus TaxID=100268 RepID=A0A8J4SJS7_9TREM|nr:hypothetical protein PHET_06836 [Paragonimus heterotremus]